MSGAGRKTTQATHFCETGESFTAYCADGHRHLPEIKQGLSAVSQREGSELVFVASPVADHPGYPRYLVCAVKRTRALISRKFLRSRYADEPYVDVLPRGIASEYGLRERGSNVCRISAFRASGMGDTVVILAVEDNLVKGAAGQAVQNMNILYGLEETTGLDHAGIWP